MKHDDLHTVAETSAFTKRAEALLSASEKDELIYALARDPQAGAEIPDTGGVRKVRWAAQGKGTKGGVRIIYFFYNEFRHYTQNKGGCHLKQWPVREFTVR